MSLFGSSAVQFKLSKTCTHTDTLPLSPPFAPLPDLPICKWQHWRAGHRAWEKMRVRQSPHRTVGWWCKQASPGARHKSHINVLKWLACLCDANCDQFRLMKHLKQFCAPCEPQLRLESPHLALASRLVHSELSSSCLPPVPCKTSH